MGVCDKCGYKPPKGYEYYKDNDSGVCLCEECYDGVDHELMDLFGITFNCVTAGIDDVDYEEDYVDDYEG